MGPRSVIARTIQLALRLAASTTRSRALGSHVGYGSVPGAPHSEQRGVGLTARHGFVFAPPGVVHLHAQTGQDLLCATRFVRARTRRFATESMRRFSRGAVYRLGGDRRAVGRTCIDLGKLAPGSIHEGACVVGKGACGRPGDRRNDDRCQRRRRGALLLKWSRWNQVRATAKAVLTSRGIDAAGAGR